MKNGKLTLAELALMCSAILSILKILPTLPLLNITTSTNNIGYQNSTLNFKSFIEIIKNPECSSALHYYLYSSRFYFTIITRHLMQ